MALIGQIAIAMKVGTKAFDRGLSRAQRSLKVFGAAASDIGAPIGALASGLRVAINEAGRFGLIAGTVAAVGLWKVAKGAMALGEQADRARVIFGEFASDINDQSKLMATAFGVSRKEYIQSASAFGTIFEGVGYAEKDAATLSNHFVKLATDLSSLAHIPVADAMEKLQSGLAGQVRPLREVGVMMSEEAIKAYAAKQGISKLGQEMTDQQKVTARIGFLTEKLAKAHGNLALTANSVANVTRSLAGRLQNLSDTAGTALNTILGPAIGELTIGVQALQMAWDSSALAAKSASVGVVGAVEGQTTALGPLQSAIGKVADGWRAVELAFSAVQLQTTGWLKWMIENLPGFSSGINKLVHGDFGVRVIHGDKEVMRLGHPERQQMMDDAFKKEWLADLDRMGKAQESAFNKLLTAPTPSEGINKAFDAARAQIMGARKELAGQAAPNLTGIKPKNEVMPTKANEVKFASAAAKGSQEAANAILRSRFGGGKTTDEIKKQTNLQTRMAAGIDKIAAATSRDVSMFVLENF